MKLPERFRLLLPSAQQVSKKNVQFQDRNIYISNYFKSKQNIYKKIELDRIGLK